MIAKLKKILRPIAHKVIAKASQSYISGEKLEDALLTSNQLLGKGYQITLAYWNRDEDIPGDVMTLYHAALDELAKMPEKNYISIKAPAFNFDRDLYGALLTRVRDLGISLHFDSLGHEAADAMFSLIQENSSGRYTDIGCSLPGRWQRSLDDAERIASLGMVGRVVKGQWEDPLHPEIDPRAGFLNVVNQLAGKAKTVRIATHDPELAKKSIEILRNAGTDSELELLYGLPVSNVLKAVKPLHVPTRIYIPYGYAWIPYALNNVRNNPKVLWWLFKDSLSGSYINRFP
jgi:proline dehydrogenase